MLRKTLAEWWVDRQCLILHDWGPWEEKAIHSINMKGGQYGNKGSLVGRRYEYWKHCTRCKLPQIKVLKADFE